jgi:hypothetical protein
VASHDGRSNGGDGTAHDGAPRRVAALAHLTADGLALRPVAPRKRAGRHDDERRVVNRSIVLECSFHDEGARAETLIACHLLKAVEGWTDLGFGDFELRHLRDKQKREADFLVVRDRKPWFLVEAKLGDTRVSPSLGSFQALTKAPPRISGGDDRDVRAR